MINAIIQKFIMPRPPRGYSIRTMQNHGYHCLGSAGQPLAWLKTPDAPLAIVCFFHGNGENASDWVTDLSFVTSECHCVLALMEFPGYADTNQRLARSSDELVSHAVDGITRIANEHAVADLPIILWGRSLGGGVAAAAAVKTPIQGLILESTFSSISLLATELVRRVPRIAMAATLYRFQLETANSLKRLDCPILIAHSEQDELIDVSHAKRNFRAADYPNQLVELYGNHNSEKHHQANYRVGLDQFASEVAAYVG